MNMNIISTFEIKLIKKKQIYRVVLMIKKTIECNSSITRTLVNYK